MAKYLVE